MHRRKRTERETLALHLRLFQITRTTPPRPRFATRAVVIVTDSGVLDPSSGESTLHGPHPLITSCALQGPVAHHQVFGCSQGRGSACRQHFRAGQPSSHGQPCPQNIPKRMKSTNWYMANGPDSYFSITRNNTATTKVSLMRL